MVDITDSERYLDLRAYFSQEHFEQMYTDFEGMADAKTILELCSTTDENGQIKYIWDILKSGNGPEQDSVVRTLFLHYLYERADTFGLESASDSEALMSWDSLCDIYEALQIATGCRYFLKVTDEDIGNMEKDEDEDEDESK